MKMTVIYMKALIVTILLVLLCSFLITGRVKAAAASGDTSEENRYVQSMLDEYDMSSVREGVDRLFPGYKIDTEKLLSLIMEGNVVQAFKELIKGVGAGMAGEWKGIKEILIYILILGIISAVFANFTEVFTGQQIAQAGFYFLYLFLMAILTRAFMFVSQIAVTTVENIVLFIKLFIPTYFLAVGAASGAATAAFYYQIMLVIAYLVESFLIAAIIPFIYSYVILALLNGIWAEERLTLLLDFIKKGILLALKISLGAITGLSMVQAVIVPVLDKLHISVFRKAISAIPGIGGVAEGVTELIIGSAVLLKNSMGVLLLILLLAACLLPLLKILAVAGAVKLGAALAGIVSDKRISGCTDRVGEGCFMLFRCVFTSVALFIIVIAVVAYASSA